MIEQTIHSIKRLRYYDILLLKIFQNYMAISQAMQCSVSKQSKHTMLLLVNYIFFETHEVHCSSYLFGKKSSNIYFFEYIGHMDRCNEMSYSTLKNELHTSTSSDLIVHELNG